MGYAWLKTRSVVKKQTDGNSFADKTWCTHRDEGLASPALIYLEVAADEAGFHFIIAFDKIDDEYILYIAVAITILDIEKLNLYTRKKHRTSKCHHIGDTDQEEQRARRKSP